MLLLFPTKIAPPPCTQGFRPRKASAVLTTYRRYLMQRYKINSILKHFWDKNHRFFENAAQKYVSTSPHFQERCQRFQ